MAPRPIILPYRGVWPKIHGSAFIAPGASVIGDVEIGPDANIWYGCVLRGDVNFIRVGPRTNIQDGTIVHVAHEGWPTRIGSDVLIGHAAIVHACTLEDGSFVGMGARVMDEATVEAGAMVAAGALVAPGKRVGAGELWTGAPAKLRRPVRAEETAENAETVKRYVRLGREHGAAARGD
ncbi:MAG: gamma carbonic anhydrase family protein [Pseudomonadota bacterium]